MRRYQRINVRAVVVLALMLTTITAFGQGASPGELTLTILHTNDLHGHLLPFAYTETHRSPDEQPSVGGAARRATLVRKLRKEITNPVVLIDAGDTFTRGPLTNAYEGIADIDTMNAIGYELAAIGNNEFKAKDGREQNDAAGAQAALLKVIRRSKFPWICANATDAGGAFLQGVRPFLVRKWKGVRVGFLGLTAPRSANYPQTKDWSITDPIAAARLWIPKARAQCDVLVAVTHLGTETDMALAAQTVGLDAIVGGDSHTFIYKAVEVRNIGGVPVPIVQTGEFGVNLGRFDLHFARSAGRWRLADYRYKLLPVGPKLQEAADVKAVLRPYLRPFEAVVGTLENVGSTPRESVRATGQAVADAMRFETKADLAFQPGGEGMYEVFRHKVVTRYDVFDVMPFKNNVSVVELTGAEIEDLRKAHPETIASGSAASPDAAKTYRVALVDFVAGSVYKLSPDRVSDTGKDVRDVVIAYLGRTRPTNGKRPRVRAARLTNRRSRPEVENLRQVGLRPAVLPDGNAVFCSRHSNRHLSRKSC